jgi:catechol 2,3-dioxygenase-like lactoylglutathione lyase family enzyme
MKLVPVFKSRDMTAAIAFYTGVLDFELEQLYTSAADPVVDLTNGDGIPRASGADRPDLGNQGVLCN